MSNRSAIWSFGQVRVPPCKNSPLNAFQCLHQIQYWVAWIPWLFSLLHVNFSENFCRSWKFSGMVSISVFIPSPLVFGFRPFSVSVSCLTLCLSTTETCLECSSLSTPNSLSSLWHLVQLLKWFYFCPWRSPLSNHFYRIWVLEYPVIMKLSSWGSPASLCCLMLTLGFWNVSPQWIILFPVISPYIQGSSCISGKTCNYVFQFSHNIW